MEECGHCRGGDCEYHMTERREYDEATKAAVNG
jgi:hypothetical protein